MTTITLDLETICTDGDLDEFLGGQLRGGVGLIPPAWESAEPARRYALSRVVDHLARLPVPIRQSDIADPSELSRAVLYGAAAHLYTLAITRAGDFEVFAAAAKRFEGLFASELETLRPRISTVLDGRDGTLESYRGATSSIGLVRR